MQYCQQEGESLDAHVSGSVYGILVLLGNCSFPCCYHKIIHWYNKLYFCGVTWGAFLQAPWKCVFHNIYI